MRLKYSMCFNVMGGLLVTMLVLWLTLSHSLYEFDSIYNKKAEAAFSSSRDMFLQHRIMLDSLQSFFQASEIVTPAEFEFFGKDLLKIKSAVAFTLTPELQLAYLSDSTMKNELSQLKLIRTSSGDVHASLAGYTLAFVTIDEPNMPYLVYAISHEQVMARIEQELGICIRYQFEHVLLQSASCELMSSHWPFTWFSDSDSRYVDIAEHQIRFNLQINYQVPQKDVIELIVIMLLIAGLGGAFSALLYFKVKNQHIVQKIQLENRSKLAVLASINHEIRTPINAILGYSRMLKEAQPDPLAFDKLIDKMMWSANLLYSVAENTLNYSKAEVGQLRLNQYSVNLHEYVSNIQDYYRAFSATSGKSLQIVVSKTLPKFIELDGTKLFQLITNIINNAFKYSTGSEVHCYIDLRLKPFKGVNRPVLRVLIRDFGQGMSVSAKRALVDPFVLDAYSPHASSSQASSSGIGLGLYTCKRLLEQIGGQFMLRSPPGKGTTVMLHFPCQLAKTEMRLAIEYAQQDILIVDDNLFSLEVCKAMLSHDGFKTLCVDNAAQALDLFRRQLPQIVIVDYRLRETNGLQLIRQMQQLLQDNRNSPERDPTCLFFLLSANNSHEIPEFDQFPEVSFMQKPFNMDLFLSKLV